MKTVKKIFPFFLLLCLCGGIFSSCEDYEDGCCDPKVSYILPSKAASKDSIIVGANAGDYIIIVGENLASVVQVLFDNVPAELNPVYITDNNIILKIPEISASTGKITLVTKYGKQVSSNFTINIPPPVIEMFYCEFLQAGEIFRIKGNYLINPAVFFFSKDGQTLINAEVVATKGTKEIFVKVPNDVGDSKPVVVQTGAGATMSKILFRDKRNIIIDFDEYKATGGGTIDQYVLPNEDGQCTWKSNTPAFDFVESLLPEAFVLPKGCDGIYGQINDWQTVPFNQGSYLVYFTELGGYPRPLPLVGEFASYDIKDLVLKFEVYIPKEYAISGVYAEIVLAPKGTNWTETMGRDLSTPGKGDKTTPGAWWVPFEANVDKTDEYEWKWEIGSKCKQLFYTDWKELSYEGDWMTVSVPLISFKWNVNWSTPLDALHLGDGDGSWALCRTEDFNKDPNPANIVTFEKYPEKAKTAGDFLFMFDPWAQRKMDNNGKPFLCFLDNFRIVPDDGGGAQFGRMGERVRPF